MKISFKHPKIQDYQLILNWFNKPHVSEWFDDPLTGSSIPDLKKYIQGENYFWTPWIGYYGKEPFAYLMTSEVKHDPESHDVWQKWRDKIGKTYSLDVMIGEEKFLGKGLSTMVIQRIIADHFQHAHAFLIDPEAKNTRAIHVYQKAGFRIVDEFSPIDGKFKDVKTIMMKMENLCGCPVN